MSRRFENRLVLVTGGAAGLGRALAVGFAQEGAQLVLVDIDEGGLKETASQLEAIGATVATHRVDLSTFGSMMPSTPGSLPSGVSHGSYAVILTPFAMPFNYRGVTARQKGRSTV